MNLFSLRVLSSLMGATSKQIDSVLAVREAEMPHGVLSYSGAYRILRRYANEPASAVLELRAWCADGAVSERTRSFRQNAQANLEWCATAVLPRIKRVVRSLDGDRQRSGQLLQLDGVSYTGGFHALVEWEDETERLIYFLGPGWTRKRVRNMLILLQMKAAYVYGRVPQSVVLVDIRRREVIELRDLDPTDRDEAMRTAAWLREYLRGREAA